MDISYSVVVAKLEGSGVTGVTAVVDTRGPRVSSLTSTGPFRGRTSERVYQVGHFTRGKIGENVTEINWDVVRSVKYGQIYTEIPQIYRCDVSDQTYRCGVSDQKEGDVSEVVLIQV